MSPDDVNTDEVAGADVVLVALDVPPEVVRTALSHAHGKVLLDPTPVPGLDAAALRAWVETFAPFVHVLLPDLPTLAALVSETDETEVVALAGGLAEQLRVNVVVPLGRQGAVIALQEQEPEVVEAPEAETVDSSGADDCFRGVLSVLLAEKTPLTEAVRIAVRATAEYSASGALPTRERSAAVSR
nr:PfkB family carbohydrate kinase [Kineosporia mesophila]